MSVINRALTDMADKASCSPRQLEKAQIKPVSNTNKLAWAVGGFSLSLCLGGWAVSQQQSLVIGETAQPISQSVQSSEPVLAPILKESPTSKVTISRDINLYQESDPVNAHNSKKSIGVAQLNVPAKPVNLKLAAVKKTVTQSESKAAVTSNQSDKKEPLAQVKAANMTDSEGSIMVEQVELAPKQLSDSAIERGKKALDSNDLQTAIQEFEIALKYIPSDQVTRKRLAALYYGKKESRSAIEVLSQGIRLDEKSQILRMALSKLLIKEGQPEMALNPLFYLPDNPDKGYLELRAALAQQSKNSEMATETYQLLVQRHPENARWWLGLAIEQERSLEYQLAKSSYQEAIRRVGISKQSQAFIRDRLSLLESLEGEKNAD